MYSYLYCFLSSLSISLLFPYIIITGLQVLECLQKLFGWMYYIVSNINDNKRCLSLAADMGEEFVSMLTELLFELHVAATPDKLNKVSACQ